MNNKIIFKKIIIYLFLIIGSIIFILPVYWLFSRGITVPDKVFVYPPQLIPTDLSFGNIRNAIENYHILNYLGNTIKIVVFTIIGAGLSCSLVGYGFARIDFKGKNVLFIVLLSSLMIPWDVKIIPLFVGFSKIGWTDSQIVPAFFTGFQGPFYVFLARQFIMGIPYELDEAAFIDGCNRFQIFTKIIFPLMKPVVASIVIFQFLFAWNDFLYPLIFLNSMEKYTLSLGIYIMKTPIGTPWGAMMATAAVSTIFPLLIFFFAQDYLMGGISVSGMKN